MGYHAVKKAAPMVLDCSIDFIDSTVYARDDIEHQVYLPNDQCLYVDLINAQIKTSKGEIILEAPYPSFRVSQLP